MDAGSIPARSIICGIEESVKGEGFLPQNVDLLVAAEDSHAGTCCGTGDAATDARLDFISSIYLRCHDGVCLLILHRQSCLIYDE